MANKLPFRKEPIEEISEPEQPNVLIIDDSDIALEAMKEVLEKENIKVLTLRSAFGATKTVLRYEIKVVVTDINMPALRGNHLVAFFRKNPKLAHVRVILVSSLPRTELKALKDEAGADDMVSKDDIETRLANSVKHQLLLSKQSK